MQKKVLQKQNQTNKIQTTLTFSKTQINHYKCNTWINESKNFDRGILKQNNQYYCKVNPNQMLYIKVNVNQFQLIHKMK